jgi:glycine betaine/choline ABC-type transport system substrate-binding protein
MRAIVVVTALLLVAACGDPMPVRVGAKSFTEQQVLAQALRTLLEASGRPARVVDCNDPFGCQQALRGGRIDVLVEYAGTAALYAGLPRETPAAEVAEAYQAQGIEVLRPLGFDNSYVVVVSEGMAAYAKLETIGDLAALGEITVAVNATYARRPRDGLPALAGRYGLRARPLVLDDAADRLDAVLTERADVAILFATDGLLKGAPVKLLEDEERFFPDYSAHVLARRVALDEASAALGKLAINTEEMRAANYAVDVEGFTPREAARRLLLARGLIKLEESRRDALTIVAPAARAWPRAETNARRAVRGAFPSRPVEFIRDGDPVQRLVDGRARLALVPASAFYRRTRPGSWGREERAEALAVVGREVLHLVTSSGATEKIGAPPAGRVERTVLDALGRRAASFASTARLLDDVTSGKLDAALILAEPGDPEITKAIQGGLKLAPMPREAFTQPVPFVRPARIPGGTYPGQGAVRTWSVQIVLAGPSARAEHVGGPAGAVISARPVNEQELRALERADGVLEKPDPALPVPWTRHVPTGAIEAGRNALLDTVLSALAILFLAWAGSLALGVQRGS